METKDFLFGSLLLASYASFGAAMYQLGYSQGKEKTEAAPVPPIPAINIAMDNHSNAAMNEPQDEIILAPRPKAQSLPLAAINNNPCNVKGRGWWGQLGIDKHGHAIFASPEYGLRAAGRVLLAYERRHGIKTIDGIIERFCTTDPKNKAHYKAFVARKVGVKVDEEIDIKAKIAVLIQAMAKYESGLDVDEKLFIGYRLEEDL